MSDSFVDHFALANPYGPGMDDVPALLRRVAETIEGLGDVHVTDLVMHTEVTGEGYWHSVTVYFSRDPADIEASRWSDSEPERPEAGDEPG